MSPCAQIAAAIVTVTAAAAAAANAVVTAAVTATFAAVAVAVAVAVVINGLPCFIALSVIAASNSTDSVVRRCSLRPRPEPIVTAD